MNSPVQDSLGLQNVAQNVNPVIFSSHNFWRRVPSVHGSDLFPEFRGGKKGRGEVMELSPAAEGLAHHQE